MPPPSSIKQRLGDSQVALGALFEQVWGDCLNCLVPKGLVYYWCDLLVLFCCYLLSPAQEEEGDGDAREGDSSGDGRDGQGVDENRATCEHGEEVVSLPMLDIGGGGEQAN
jgi:hypothetical protein